MTMTERAARLGISSTYLSMIFNGRRLPGWKTVERWNNEAVICKSMKWWRSAGLSDIQKVINKVDGNGFSRKAA